MGRTNGDDELEGGADAFAVLADHNRVDILRALSVQQREEPADPTLTFSELRERVDIADSGNFNYHLDKLRGRFVEQGDDGEYRLTNAGQRIVSAVVAGAYADYEAGPVEDVRDCPVCDAAMTGSYRAGELRLECPEEHFLRLALPANAVRNRSLAAAAHRLTITAEQQLELATIGICPFCYGGVDWEAQFPDDDAIEVVFKSTCETCGARLTGTAGTCLVRHPAVVGFCYEHGIDPRGTAVWDVSLPGSETTTVLQEDPLRVRVDLTLEGERLEATLDGDLNVQSVDRSAGDDGSEPGDDT